MRVDYTIGELDGLSFLQTWLGIHVTVILEYPGGTFVYSEKWGKNRKVFLCEDLELSIICTLLFLMREDPTTSRPR